MTDRAPQVAAYLAERQLDGAGPNTLWAELRQRWPGLTIEEGARGALIAEEILVSTLAENEVTHDAVEGVLTGRAAVAEAIAHLGEAEF